MDYKLKLNSFYLLTYVYIVIPQFNSKDRAKASLISFDAIFHEN